MDVTTPVATKPTTCPIQNTDSPLPTASRRCQSSPPATRRIPTSAEQNRQRANILRTFRKNNLAFRSITIANEKEYLDNPQTSPRPVYMVGKGMPVQMRSSCQTTIAITNPRILSAYKENAGTCVLTEGKLQPDELDVACLPDLSSLQRKMIEQTVRKEWEVYPDASSGHLTIEGIYTQPKPKSSARKPVPLISHSELLTEYYEKNQIVSYCVSSDDPRDISTVLSDKHEVEHSLGLEPLPITVYSALGGSIQVWFEDELQPTDDLAYNEPLLDDYARSLAVDPTVFRKKMAMLPWPERVRFLNSFRAYYTPLPPSVPSHTELLRLVKTPNELDSKKLKACFDRGARIDFDIPGTGSLIYNFLCTEGWHNVNRENNDALSQKARSMLTELVRCGSKVSKEESLKIGDHHVSLLTHLFDYLVAANLISQSEDIFNDVIFYRYPVGPAATIAYHRQFEASSFQQIQQQLEGLLLSPFKRWLRFTENYHEQLLMLFCYGADPRPFRQALIEVATLCQKKFPNYYSKMCKNRTPTEHADEMITLWEKRKSEPFFNNWPNKVEQDGKKIAELQETLAPYPLPACATERVKLEQHGQPIMTAFQTPPVLSNAGENEETVLNILEHYYRRPGPERILQNLSSNRSTVAWKAEHSCSHVLRARNNVHWYMELLEQFNILQFSDDEKSLLALAAVYHDAAAEDVSKDEEERRSACYFRRDLAPCYPTELVDKIAEALTKKEDDIHGHNEDGLDERLRSYLRVLRFGDRMDFIRCSRVGRTFPDWSDRKISADEFNVHLLDLPPQQKAAFSTVAEQKTDFQCALEAAMHGAVDLASVTGGARDDLRAHGDYTTQHRLKTDNDRLLCAFEKTPQPVSRMDNFLNDNVRRMIAKSAGINSCDPKNHPTCNADTKRGVSHGIHNSWHDLAQVQIPAGMTRLEKMQYGYDPSLLSAATKRGIETEIARLKKEGIAMSLGSLTQQTLKSPAAISALAERKIDVVTENRLRGWSSSNSPIFQQMRVPKERA